MMYSINEVMHHPIASKTSMMWPSQNFLLYNGIIIKIKVNEWINNLKNMLIKKNMSPSLGDTYNMYKL